MKKLITLIGLFLFIACDNQEATKEEQSEIKTALNILAERGYDVENYELYEQKVGEKKTHIIVEGDHMFDMKDLLNPRVAKQYRTTNTLSDNQVQNIEVAIYQGNNSYGVTSAWISHVRQAMTDWESISGTKVNFTEVTYNGAGSYDIVVYMDNLGTSGTLARSSFPQSNGDAGTTIVINTVNYGLSTSEKHFTMTHEFGHSLAFRHTNWFDRNSDGNATTDDNEGQGSDGAVHISGTPTGLDANSVMNAIVAPWNGFGQYDEVALQDMYPSSTPPVSGIQGPSSVPSGQSATFTSPAGSSYQWWYNTGSRWRKWTGVTSQSVTFSYSGTVSLAVVVNNSDVYYKYNIVFN